MRTILSATVVMALGAAAAVPVAAQTKWDMPMAYPATNYHSVNAQKFADAVKAATGGQLVITTHPGASLFKLPEIKRAVQTGQAQIGEILDVSLENESAVLGVGGVPFLTSSYADAKKLYEASKPVIGKQFDAWNAKLLYAVAWPPQGFYANKPIESVRDMEGLKWRAYSPATNRLGELLKAQPITVQAAELSQALATGKVNSMATSSQTGMDSKVWEQLKYFYDVQGWQPKNMVIVNKDAFAKLDRKTQGILLDEAKKAEDAGWAASEAAQKLATETLAKNGMTVSPPSAQFKKELQGIGNVMTEEWLKKAGADGKAIIDAYRKM